MKMAYKHKREKCAEETKEILEKIMLMRKAEYESIDGAKTVTVTSPMGRIIHEEATVNVLPSETEEIIVETEGSKLPLPSDSAELEGIENYTSTIDIDLKQEKAKEIFETARKKRNYIELR